MKQVIWLNVRLFANVHGKTVFYANCLVLSMKTKPQYHRQDLDEERIRP